MKAIKKILTSLFVLCLFLGYTACTEQVGYDPAQVPENAQVYFSSTLPAKINLSQDVNVNSYDIELRRIDKTDALTVNLNVENGAPDIFTVPSSASFAAGSDVAKITLVYNYAKLGYDNFKSFRIAVSDASLTSEYGKAVYTFTAGILAPWKTLGKATFNSTYAMQGGPWKVDLQQHELFPNRYRLVNPFAQAKQGYGNMPFTTNKTPYLEFIILPANTPYTTFHRDLGTVTVSTTSKGFVFYEPTPLGMIYNPTSDNAEVYIWHPVARPATGVNTQVESYWRKNMVTRWSKDGSKPEIVQLAPWYVMPAMGGAGWNNTQLDNQMTIIFPGVVLANYSVGIKYAGRFVDPSDNSFAVANVTLGPDVEYAQVALVRGSMTQAVLNGVLNGSIESVQVESSGQVHIPVKESGEYTFVAVSYGDGEAQEFDYQTFSLVLGGSGWTSLGFCKYTDDVLLSLYVDDPSWIPTYDVEIFEKVGTPGLFRLKNAYGADYPYNDPGDYVESDVFIEINATDPDGVFITYQSMGVDWGFGNNYIYSYAGYFLDNGYTLDAIKKAGYCGTYKNGIITFPKSRLLIEDDDDIYDANVFGMFKVDMTKLRSSASKSAPLRSSWSRPGNLKKTSPVKLERRSSQPVKVSVDAPLIMNTAPTF